MFGKETKFLNSVRIRIRFIWIRIQVFSNADPDPAPGKKHNFSKALAKFLGKIIF